MAEEISRIQQGQLRSILGPTPAQEVLGDLPAAGKTSKATDGPSFGEALKESINEVNRLNMEAQKAQMDLVTGENRDVHSTVIAMQKADVSFRLMMEVRNKLVDAYKEVMRMQV